MPSTTAAADGSQGAGAGATARPRQAAVLEDSDDDSPQAEPEVETADVPMPDASQVRGTAASCRAAFALTVWQSHHGGRTLPYVQTPRRALQIPELLCHCRTPQLAMQQQAMIWTISLTAGMTHRQAGRGQRQVSKLRFVLLDDTRSLLLHTTVLCSRKASCQ